MFLLPRRVGIAKWSLSCVPSHSLCQNPDASQRATIRPVPTTTCKGRFREQLGSGAWRLISVLEMHLKPQLGRLLVRTGCTMVFWLVPASDQIRFFADENLTMADHDIPATYRQARRVARRVKWLAPTSTLSLIHFEPPTLRTHPRDLLKVSMASLPSPHDLQLTRRRVLGRVSRRGGPDVFLNLYYIHCLAQELRWCPCCLRLCLPSRPLLCL